MEEVKVFLFTDYIVLYIRDTREKTRKLLELINSFSKVAGHTVINNICSLPTFQNIFQ